MPSTPKTSSSIWDNWAGGKSKLNENIRGDAQTYNNDTYRVNSHSYPFDLMSPTGIYGGNYVVFYINVNIESKLLKELTEDDLVAIDQVPVRDQGDLIAQNMTTKQLFGSAAALNLGGAAIGKILGVGGGASAGLAALATVGAGAIAVEAPSASRQQRRLKTAIALHIPNQLSIRYGMQWSEEDTLALAAAGAGFSEVSKAVESGNIKNLSEPAKAFVSSIAANIALSKGPNAAGMSAATGLAANPKKEQVFKGVDFRTFTFEYQFFPRDSDEAKNVMNIIKQFKYHMHPEFKDPNNFLYIYPSEFDITYYQAGVENLNLHRHTSCVLTEMNVNYTPNGAFTTFDDGMPTQINITLSFRELALLTKDKVKDGL